MTVYYGGNSTVYNSEHKSTLPKPKQSGYRKKLRQRAQALHIDKGVQKDI